MSFFWAVKLQNTFCGGFDGDILCSNSRRRTSGPVVGKVGSCPGQLPCHGGLLLLWQISNKNLLNLLPENWIHGLELQNVKANKSSIIMLTIHKSQKNTDMASMQCLPRKSTSIENPNHFWHFGSRIQMDHVWGQKHRFNVTWYDVNRPPLWKIKNCKSSKCESKSKQLRKKRRGNLWTWAVTISGGHYLWLVSGRKKFHKELFHPVVITFSQSLDFSSTKQLFPRGGNLMSFWWRALRLFVRCLSRDLWDCVWPR